MIHKKIPDVCLSFQRYVFDRNSIDENYFFNPSLGSFDKY